MRFLNTISVALTSALAVAAEKIYHCTEPNTIALTFDDGPYEYTMDLLDQLQAHNIHATFFINGYNFWHDLETDPEKQAVLKRAHADGHQIASHTWRHAIPEDLDEIQPMMSRLDDLIEKCTGYRPKYFRAPQGHCKEDCIGRFEELGYNVIQWDTDTNDWDKSIGVENRIAEVKKYLTNEWAKEKDNYLILMHDVHNTTVYNIVPWVLENAPYDKYKFVTVAECLGDYQETHYDAQGNPLSNTIGGANNAVVTDPNVVDNTVPGVYDPATDINSAPVQEVNREVPGATATSEYFNLQKADSSDAQKITFGFTLMVTLLAFLLF